MLQGVPKCYRDALMFYRVILNFYREVVECYREVLNKSTFWGVRNTKCQVSFFFADCFLVFVRLVRVL